MNITVLGCHGPYPPAGGACSGYLLEHEKDSILLDCGNGILSNLQYHINLHRLTAVILSHLHSDHISDLFIMRYALQIDLEQGKRNKPLKIYAPAEPAEEIERLRYKDVYEITTILEGEDINISSLHFSFLKTLHSVTTYAIRVKDNSGRVLVYSGDTAYFPELIPFARDSDLFLCESNYLQADIDSGAPNNHLSAAQSADLALCAGVKKLLLTHLAPYHEESSYLAEASPIFNATSLAAKGNKYSI